MGRIRKNPAVAGFCWSELARDCRRCLRATISRLRRVASKLAPTAGLVDNAHVLAHLRAFLLEFHVPVLLGKQRVIATTTDVGAGVETGAALAHDDVACYDFLATEDLDAESSAGFGWTLQTRLY